MTQHTNTHVLTYSVLIQVTHCVLLCVHTKSNLDKTRVAIQSGTCRSIVYYHFVF